MTQTSTTTNATAMASRANKRTMMVTMMMRKLNADNRHKLDMFGDANRIAAATITPIQRTRTTRKVVTMTNMVNSSCTTRTAVTLSQRTTTMMTPLRTM